MPDESPSAETAFARRSARILLLDKEDRLLLFRFLVDRHAPEQGHFWATPGGGVDEGEQLRAAAIRELHEETGLLVSDDELGPHVALSGGPAVFSWAQGLFQDDFFFHRVQEHQVDTSGFEELEASQITQFRWWPLAELAATGETVYPLGLAPLLADLAAGRIPQAPVRLPWHH